MNEGIKLNLNLLPKGFLWKNPVNQISAAAIAYLSVTVGFDQELESSIITKISKDFSVQRTEKIKKEKEVISKLKTGEEFIHLMEKGCDVANRNFLSKRILATQEEVIPLILRRFFTSMQDEFIETSVPVFAYAKPYYINQLKKVYPFILNPYAQSMACLIFGIQEREDTLPILIAEYLRMKKEYPGEALCQGPLIAIHALCHTLPK